VTSKTTFSLKSIFLKEKERQRGMKGAFLIHKEACYTCPTHPSFYNKKIGFKDIKDNFFFKINFFKRKWETKGG
jgi:hypothetical protein